MKLIWEKTFVIQFHRKIKISSSRPTFRQIGKINRNLMTSCFFDITCEMIDLRFHGKITVFRSFHQVFTFRKIWHWFVFVIFCITERVGLAFQPFGSNWDKKRALKCQLIFQNINKKRTFWESEMHSSDKSISLPWKIQNL